jgi:hypothetical protein
LPEIAQVTSVPCTSQWLDDRTIGALVEAAADAPSPHSVIIPQADGRGDPLDRGAERPGDIDPGKGAPGSRSTAG